MDKTYIKAVKLMLRIALGLIGHNGAGNQAAGQPLGRLPQAARSSAGGKAQLKKILYQWLRAWAHENRLKFSS